MPVRHLLGGNEIFRVKQGTTKPLFFDGYKIMFKNNTRLITGGTCLFGNVVLGRYLKTNIKEIRILSNEKNILHN